MNLMDARGSPTRIRKRVRAELRSLRHQVKAYGSKDDIADDLFGFANVCIRLRLVIYKAIALDNIMHREMADLVTEGKRPAVSLKAWEEVISGAVATFAAELRRCTRLWRRNSLDKFRKAFGFGIQQLLEAESAAAEFLDALQD